MCSHVRSCGCSRKIPRRRNLSRYVVQDRLESQLVEPARGSPRTTPTPTPSASSSFSTSSGRKYRLVARIFYADEDFRGRVYVLHVLTHKDYDTEKWKSDCDCD